MSTSQSDEKEGGKYVTTQVCNATKEELLRGGNYEVMDDCPLCLKRGVTLEVGNHRSKQYTGKCHCSCLLLHNPPLIPRLFTFTSLSLHSK